MRSAILIAGLVARCGGSTSVNDEPLNVDTDIASTAPYCDGSATLGTTTFDPCEKAGATLAGVEPAAVAADWNFSFGTEECFWVLKLDDVCADGSVWMGGGAKIRWSGSRCQGAPDGDSTGYVELTNYDVQQDGSSWLVSTTVGFHLDQNDVPLRGEVDVVWRVPNVSDSSNFDRCSNERITDDGSSPATSVAVDVLLVMDNSCSMVEEQQQLADTMPTLLDTLIRDDVDFHIGVITTDATDVRHKGKLQSAGGRKVVDSATPNPVAVLGQLILQGTNGSATEQGLSTATLALTEPLKSGANAGFLRNDADLAIVVISDEEDQSAPAVSTTDFISGLQALVNGGKGVTFSSIVGPAPGGCRSTSGDAVAGTVYLAVTEAFPGVALSICDTDWSGLRSGLTGVPGTGGALQIALSQPAVPESIKVVARETTGSRVVPPRDWKLVGDRVVVERTAVEKGAVLTVTYAVAR